MLGKKLHLFSGELDSSRRQPYEQHLFLPTRRLPVEVQLTVKMKHSRNLFRCMTGLDHYLRKVLTGFVVASYTFEVTKG